MDLILEQVPWIRNTPSQTHESGNLKQTSLRAPHQVQGQKDPSQRLKGQGLIDITAHALPAE